MQKKNILKKLFSRGIRENNFPAYETNSAVSSGRFADNGVNLLTLQREGFNERQLYDNLRSCVPIVDAALQKIVRLTGCYKVVCSDSRYQSEMDDFIDNVPVGTGGNSLYAFTDAFLDSLLTYGSAAGNAGQFRHGKR